MGQINQPATLLDRIRRLEQELAEVRKKVGLSSAVVSRGGLTIKDNGHLRVLDSAGVERFFIGAGSPNLPNGDSQPLFIVRDGSGRRRLAVYDPVTADGYEPVFWVWDHIGHVAFTTDRNGGVAEPWTAVPLYPQFEMGHSSHHVGYTMLPVSALTTGPVVWEGWIGKVSHPRLQILGYWGRATGTSPVSVTYEVRVGHDQTVVGSWVSTGIETALYGPWDISPWLSHTNIPVRLSIRATSGDATDMVAVQVLSCWMRQT
ncbi:hypothetical protein LX15_004811 [Streptoalloteichus tenebrarius]|uniref:Uncharacterized protein n=1 Tax=Streptoalloteichus tenebrarius (strain ATCC 17920 / DSM 40477 / JCM 4838 / CBS 697.72 / NBRC 16177 / NCIMB 11028 / NRRL B-12390 / A12253. 1 / ISP 5477) TaxID=1933 RepID=A0ABT1I034_STRSD|nr:hypothetical protein [Streptoalloteichus tenebrarius]MCP2261091.1 hypothetical protein [Streptoalloteichus tenebrarius]BFF03113.1 hypothetical protein GCM10020241_47880 [Streptoalloteichus tenebrarius]